MNKYSFTFVVKGHSVCSDDMADAIYEAGADDAGVSSRDGIVHVHFDREAISLDEAIRSAIGNLSAAGYQAGRLEIEAETIQLLTA